MTDTHPGQSSSAPVLSKRASEILRQLVVVQGRSYVDAIRSCEQTADVAAKKARAPYDEVTALLRAELGDPCRDCGHPAHGIDPCPEIAVPRAAR